MTVTAPEVRAAKSFLRQNVKAGTRDIPPRKFAMAAKELKVPFKQLIAFLARLADEGQNDGRYRLQRIQQEAQREE